MRPAFLKFFTVIFTSFMMVQMHTAVQAGAKGSYFGGIPDMTVPQGSGVTLREVVPESPAAEAGLQAGDTIEKFGETAVRNVDDLQKAIQEEQYNKDIEVIYIRKGEKHTAYVTLKPFW